MAKRSFYVKDSELDDYQVKVINKKTDNSYIVKGCHYCPVKVDK